MRTTEKFRITPGAEPHCVFRHDVVRMSGQARRGTRDRITMTSVASVTGARGPEAGVWVIAGRLTARRRDSIKSVVTDDRGRFVVPGPAAGEYDVWSAVTGSSIRRKSRAFCRARKE
jgi:hypothetical protein